MHVTPVTNLATALLANGDDGGGSALGFLLPMLVIGVAMYFLLIRPQRKRQRAAADLQRSIEVGDEVMTTSGMYGFVTGFDGDIAWLEVDDNVQIRISRAAVQRRVDTAAGDTAQPTDDGTPGRRTKLPGSRDTVIDTGAGTDAATTSSAAKDDDPST